MKRTLVLTTILLMCIITAQAQQYIRTAHGLRSTINGTDINIEFYSADIVRVLKSPAGRAYEKKSFSVIKNPENTILKISRKGNIVLIASNSTNVTLNLENEQIKFANAKHNSLLEEKEASAKFTPMMDSTTSTFSVAQSFQLKDGEAIYGLGQHQTGTMNHRNHQVTLKQGNMNVGVPVMYSVKGYSVFWDNTSTTTFKDDNTGTSFNSEVGDCIDYYFINGAGNADRTIARYRDLTGKVPMLPKWVFGFFQSRERYKSQYESVGVLKKYRDLHVPIDAMVQDWQYWGVDDNYWNSTEFGNPLFPNPKAMVDSIHMLHGHMIISVWPSFGEKTKIYADMAKHGFLYKDYLTYPPKRIVRAYDAFNPKARDLYWSYINKNLLSLDLDGWWLDSTEPDHSRPKIGDENMLTYAGSYRKVRNAYPLMTTGGVYEHQRATTAAKRVVILARSAFAGQQRNSTVVWSGDVQSRWEVLRNQISGGLNLSLTGIPYWNSDIGGFFSSNKYPLGVKDQAYRELYTRWFQFGAFCPMFRSHGTQTPREIFQFGGKGDWAYDTQEKFINLRYRLLPYNYSNAWAITANASTMMRALAMDFPNDEKAYDINNQYMFGKAFLVCPVTDSLYTSRANGVAVADFSTIKKHDVYLPAGTAWYDFWTGEKISGGQEIQKEVPIDIMPLYVKAGSIIPMGPFIQYTTEKTDPIEVRIYAGANGTFDLYEDENDNYNYEKGKHAIIHFKWDDKQKTLSISDRVGSFAGMQLGHIFNIVLVKPGNGTGLAAGKTTKQVKYTGTKATVKLI
ncbi:MAG: TIM-barrel domain-containing protein [Mucilaginibacter sp.]